MLGQRSGRIILGNPEAGNATVIRLLQQPKGGAGYCDSLDILLQWNSAPFTAGDAIPLSIQIKDAGLVIRAFLSRFEIPRPRPSSIQLQSPIGGRSLPSPSEVKWYQFLDSIGVKACRYRDTLDNSPAKTFQYVQCSKDSEYHFLKASINALPNSIAFRTLLAFSELPPKLDSHPDVLSAILSATNRSTV